MPSPYDVLGVPDDADEQDIERAYRDRVIDTHPDHGGSAHEFRRVIAAYDQLRTAPESGDHEADWDPVGEPSVPRDARIEYLNFEVLEERGWSLDDVGLFEKAAAAGLDPSDYGEFLAQPDETLLEAAENRGFTWPYACRGGACANCAVAVADGDLSQPVNHVLPSRLTDQGLCLSCVGVPRSERMQVVFNVKHLPTLDELRLPPRRFELDQRRR